jgi:alpha-tubulin suppressor-like RCC1 family protein
VLSALVLGTVLATVSTVAQSPPASAADPLSPPVAIRAIAVGIDHACGLADDGAVWCWGRNDYGQLGDGTTTDRWTPVAVQGLDIEVASLTAGNTITCALSPSGEVRCWGRPDASVGEASMVPAPVSGLPGPVRSISAGVNHVCAVTTAGAAWCWGSNTSGQLGDGTTTPSVAPVAVSGLGSGVRSISAGSFHTCAVTSANAALCWGQNNVGQVGNSTIGSPVTTPAAVTGLTSTADSISAGYLLTCAVSIYGAPWCWGSGLYGGVGDGGQGVHSSPTLVAGLSTGVLTIDAGGTPFQNGFIPENGACAVTTAYQVRCWGAYALPNGNRSLTPVTVTGTRTDLSSGVAEVSVGGTVRCALTGKGVVQCWGPSSYGQTGTGPMWITDPVEPAGLDVGSDLTTSGSHTCALDGSVPRCWGSNASGQLGQGTSTPLGSAAPVVGITSATDVSAGSGHTCAVAAGAARCWGIGADGRLGNGSNLATATPVAVTTLTDQVSDISAGSDHTCAVRDGAAWCWGDNDDGELGNGSTTGSTTPHAVSGMAQDVTTVAAGTDFTCAVRLGDVWCWGNGTYGRLGDGASTSSTVPVQVALPSGEEVVDVTADGRAACARTVDGELWCWGRNSQGELGDGTQSDRAVPVQVGGLPAPAIDVDLGYEHGCAVLDDGSTWCWGANLDSETGQQPSANVLQPTPVPNLPRAVGVAAGGSHTCVDLGLEGVRCWGSNLSGQLGVPPAHLGPVVLPEGAGTFYVGDPPVITVHPTDQTSGYPNTTAHFTYQATSGAPSTASWQRSLNGGATWSATSSTSSVPGVFELTGSPAIDQALYRVRVFNVYGSATSNPARLTVDWPAAITTQPAPQTVHAGQPATFTVGASGRPNSYQWERGTIGVSGAVTWTTIPGADAASYTFTTAGSDTLTVYRVKVSNPYGATLTSNQALLTVVVQAPQVTVQPLDRAIAEGAGATFTAAASGIPSPSVRWQRSEDEGGSWADITGATTTTLSVAAASAADDGAWVRAVFTNSAGTATSGPAVLRVDGATPRSAPSVLEAGDSHSCVLREGTVLCWGANASGQLGDGSTTRAHSPRSIDLAATVLEGRAISGVAAGGSHTCAWGIRSLLACWGADDAGQLGDGGTATDAARPVAVATAGTVLDGKRITQMVAGRSHTCALTVDGDAACWGSNAQGQLGTGTFASSSVPVTVRTVGSPLAGQRIAVLEAGNQHTCALSRSGVVACWGLDNSNQLGDRKRVNSPVPVAPTSALPALAGRPLVALSAGYDHTCAQTGAAATICWGANGVGQLGTGTTSSAVPPTEVAVAGTPLAGQTATHLAGGQSHTCARTAAGIVSCWGRNSQGQIGDGTTVDALVPAPLDRAGGPLDGRSLVAVTAGQAHSCALAVDGTVACWGSNAQGQLGAGTFGGRSPRPVATLGASAVAPGAPAITGVVAGDREATVTWEPPASDGGSGVTGYVVTPEVGGVAQDPTPFASSATSGTVSGLTNGTAYRFRVTAVNAAGPGAPSAPSAEVVPTAPATPAARGLAVGTSHSCAVLDDVLRCWGSNGSGQLGTGPGTGSSTRPAAVAVTGTPLEGATVVGLAAGGAHTCAVVATGGVACWGGNATGQLGTGSLDGAPTPAAVAIAGTPLEGAEVVQVVAGDAHTCALTAAGAVACWGRNVNGEVGDGTNEVRTAPTALATAGTPLEGRRIVALAAGSGYTCAVTSDGGVACWGFNNGPQFGNRSRTSSSVPVSPTVAGTALEGRAAVAVGAGYGHTCVTTTDGALVCWGANSYGQLGTGGTATAPLPTLVATTGTVLEGRHVASLSLGLSHTCATTTDGAVACWGRNANGQVGDGSTVDAKVPRLIVEPSPGAAPAAVAAGSSHTCARLATGATSCWGANNYGQLGDGSTTRRSLVPVAPSPI